MVVAGRGPGHLVELVVAGVVGALLIGGLEGHQKTGEVPLGRRGGERLVSELAFPRSRPDEVELERLDEVGPYLGGGCHFITPFGKYPLVLKSAQNPQDS